MSDSRADGITKAITEMLGGPHGFMLLITSPPKAGSEMLPVEIVSNLSPDAAYTLVAGGLMDEKFLRIAHPEAYEAANH